MLKQIGKINNANIELKNLNCQLIKQININKQIFSDKIFKLENANSKFNNELFKKQKEIDEKNKMIE